MREHNIDLDSDDTSDDFIDLNEII